jgi:hypothetical protein
MAKSVDSVLAGIPFFDDDVVAADVLVQTGDTILLGYDIHNVSGADAFLQCFNAAAVANVTVGTTTPDYVISAAANAVVQGSFPRGIAFPLGLVIASTTATGGASGAAQDVSLVYG